MIPDKHRSEARESASLAAAAPVRGSNQGAMRAYNERLVLSLIRQFGPKPKAEIARLTGLSPQTVSVIMRALEGEGLLVKGEPVRGSIGQPSVPMGLAANGAYFLGLKVGRGGSELVLSDFLGQVIRYQRVEHRVPSPSGVLRFANETIDTFLASLPEDDRSRVAGLGIALPFRMWDWAHGEDGANSSDLEAWRGRDLVAELAKSYSFPTYLCNDGSAACSAELVFGTTAKPRDFLYVYVGYFVGGGLVLDNALHLGRSGNAAALASMPVQALSGGMCSLVDIASLACLEDSLGSASDAALSIWGRSGEWAVPKEALDAWLGQAARGIAQAVIASVCVVDCETVLVDGSMPDAVRAELVSQIEHEVASLVTAGVSAPRIAQGSIGYDAKVLGAASLPLSERFLVERNAYLKD
ncbi:ROK family transcriptional regulator [Lutimaribacter marinistellae]|uniref:ROK family transcriptional regulator n=1 Tax=Lutimaribacter marinistellae TaxID=1820329 RepID=A0ABV7TGX4_9RHOB